MRIRDDRPRNGTAPPARDFREFVFTASGADTDLGAFDPLDLQDNLALELDRLEAVAGLLLAAGDRIEPRALGGVGLLLGDIHARMREIMRAAASGRRGTGARGQGGRGETERG